MSNQPLISVIIPVYNVEKYLPRCLDSVVKQTYTNLEIILVDDGSTDSCPKICDKYAQKDKRIFVIHQTNSGLPAARNSGMDHMHGEFFTFIDSDDWVTPDYCQTLLNTITHTKTDVATANYTYAYEKDIKPSFCPQSGDKIFLTEEEILRFGFTYHHTAWLKLYRTSVCASLRFDPNYTLSEDLDFFFRLCKQIKSLAYTEAVLLYYYQHPTSLLRSVDVAGRKKILILYETIENYCKEKHFIKAQPLIRSFQLEYGCILAVLLIVDNTSFKNPDLQEIYSWVKKNKRDIFHLKSMQMLGHLFIRMFYFFPRLTACIFRTPVIKYPLKKIVLKRVLKAC